MRTFAASSKHSVFVDRIVELRMIREKDRGTRGGGFCGHVLLRVNIGLEIFDARMRRIVYRIESGAARIRNVDWPAAVRHGKSVGQRAWRMARGKPDSHGCIAERYLHAVGGDNIAFRRHRFVAVWKLLDQLPIGPTHNNSRTVPCLQHLGPSDVIDMSMGDDYILDVLRVETELLHSTDDQLLEVIRIYSIYQNDTTLRC